ncbi:E3 ubiquitin-protein ligase RNF8-like [Diachasmimorpha longicaudata]|uniref:E3 ubiquitin-protein ligase RNF8-like n=1 Tax=Diachasmimorpha longicaudata TaxID=58733 RepID=UPI0030B88C62
MEEPTEEELSSNRRERTVELVPVLVKANKEKFDGCDIEINTNSFKLGRGPDNNGIILDVSISRNHCVITKTENEFEIVDLSSSGTLVNGRRLIRSVIYPLKLNDELEFGDKKEFIYTLRMCPKEENLAVKKPEMEVDLIKQLSERQNIFEECQEAQIKEIEDKIFLKQNQTEELTSRLNELRKQKEVVQGESLEKNNQIKLMEEQIQASNDNQSQLQEDLKQLVDSMTDERRQFKVMLLEERRKWQEALNMRKQEREAFKKNMAEQMMNWKEQQLAVVASEKETLQKKLEETEKALKEQAAVAEQFRNQSVLLSGVTPKKDCSLYKLNSNNGDKKREVLETIDLTGENAPSTSSKGAEVGNKIMTAIDEQFTCSICTELFVMATTLNCTHTFCFHCIRTWRNKKRYCPICWSPIKSMNRALVVDNFIDEAVANLSQEEQESRTQLLKERRDLEAALGISPSRQSATKRGATDRAVQQARGAPVPQLNLPGTSASNEPQAQTPRQGRRRSRNQYSSQSRTYVTYLPQPEAPNQPSLVTNNHPAHNQAFAQDSIRVVMQHAMHQMRFPMRNAAMLPALIQRTVQLARMPAPPQVQRAPSPPPSAPQYQTPRRR